MAAVAVMAEATRNLAAYPIEFLFDLDMVLSGSDDFGCCQIGASDSPVADFPTTVEADVCAVCLEDFRPDESGKQIPCGHVYHEPCISSWLAVGGDCCPLCRCLVAAQPPELPSCSLIPR